MSFRKKWWLSFASGFLLATLLLSVAVWQSGSRVGGMVGAVFVLGFFSAAIVSMVRNGGLRHEYWSDRGSRGNPYHVVETEENLLGAFADGFVKLSSLALLMLFLYLMFCGGFRS